MNGLPPHIAQVICGHRDISTTMGYKNPLELHQLGEKPQVSRSREGRDSVLRPSDGGSVTRQVSRVLPSDAGSVRWRVEVIRGALFKRTEEEKGLGGWAPAPRRGIRTVGITDSAISDLPGRSHRSPPRLHHPPPAGPPQRGIPDTDRGGMGPVPRPLRKTQAVHRHLRPRLRHAVHPRARDIRCSLLRPDPAQRARLEEMRANLHDRISEADARAGPAKSTD